jgi:tetratricopeptide (TPR) repeat protein
MTIRSNLKRLAAVSTEIPRIHYREGLESGFIGDYESAIDSFDRVNYITLGTSYWTKKSQFFKACAYDQLEQYDKAIEEYKKFLEDEKKDSHGWNNLGACYADLGEYDDALLCFEKSIKLESTKKDPDQELLESAWSNKGDIVEKGAFGFKPAFQSEPSGPNENWFEDKAKIAEAKKDELKNYELLNQCVNEILKLNPESQDGLSLKTALLWLQEKNDEAIENDRKLCKLDPDSWENWNSLATAYANVNNVDEALKYFQKAIEIQPNEDEPWYNKACMLSKMNKIDDALDALLVAISIAPENLSGLSDESDFDNIKNSERFQKFLKLPC